ncbi:MAG TPA: ABC transporter permease [Candidatus Limnocylindrales bacterium]|nr:ABC transporter permease [Candidatus Limnocylindrales bacterium]
MSSHSQVRTYRAAEHPNPLELIAQGFREIWSRRRLTRYLVQADLHRHGADTVLGNIWWVLDPLLQMIVYVILVSVIFQRATEDYALFVFAAILPWKWFSASVNDSITSVTSRERIIKQVSFPKIVLPVAATSSGIVSFAFGMIPLLGLMLLFYADRISLFLLLIPVVAVVQLAFTLGIAIFVSSVNVFFRDIGNVARHGLRIWFYLSPGLYGLDALTGNPTLQSLMRLNPWATLFESYRDLIYYGTFPQWGPLAILLVVSIVFLGIAMIFFKRVEPAFAKVL